MKNTSRQITSLVRPYYRDYDWLQTYYSNAIKAHLAANKGRYIEISASRNHRILRLLWKIRRSYRISRIIRNPKRIHQLLDDTARIIEGHISTPSSLFHGSVGQYIFQDSPSQKKKICIDVHDSGEICSKELVEWSDIYFKTNYWADLTYPENVKPMINGNPFILDHLGKIRALRTREKKYDICFIVRIWTDIYEKEQMEYIIRLMEEVSRVKCRKYIRAFIAGKNDNDVIRKLDEKRISYSLEPLPIQTLWQISAESVLNIIRLGIFYCVPWRMTDLLAMGACPVLDRDPFTRWPKILMKDINYLSLGLNVGPERHIASKELLEEVPNKIEYWLNDVKRIREVYQENIEYYEKYMEPGQLGKCIYESIMNKC